MRYLIVMAMLVFSLAGRAGTVGNGGDVLICDKNTGIPNQILDVREAEVLNGWKYDYPVGLNSWKEIAKYIIKERLEAHSPLRASMYIDYLESFMLPDQLEFTDEELHDIPDSGPITIPNGCVIKQIAVQRSDSDLGFGGKRYLINKDLWNQIDEQQRAVLVMHEIILREAILKKHENSMPSRFLNSYLFSKIHMETSAENIFKEINKVFPGSTAQNISSLPFGHKLLKEKVVYVIDKSGSNTNTDPKKQKRRDIFQSLQEKYFDVDFSQAWITFSNDAKYNADWEPSKNNFNPIYQKILSYSDNGSSNLRSAVQKLLYEFVNKINSDKFDRIHVVIMLDGPPNLHNADLMHQFRYFVPLMEYTAIKFHFVQYGVQIDGLDEISNLVNGQMYKDNEIYNIQL